MVLICRSVCSALRLDNFGQYWQVVLLGQELAGPSVSHLQLPAWKQQLVFRLFVLASGNMCAILACGCDLQRLSKSNTQLLGGCAYEEPVHDHASATSVCPAFTTSLRVCSCRFVP